MPHHKALSLRRSCRLASAPPCSSTLVLRLVRYPFITSDKNCPRRQGIVSVLAHTLNREPSRPVTNASGLAIDEVSRGGPPPALSEVEGWPPTGLRRRPVLHWRFQKGVPDPS
jgi:hypothetical protein